MILYLPTYFITNTQIVDFIINLLIFTKILIYVYLHCIIFYKKTKLYYDLN